MVYECGCGEICSGVDGALTAASLFASTIGGGDIIKLAFLEFTFNILFKCVSQPLTGVSLARGFVTCSRARRASDTLSVANIELPNYVIVVPAKPILQ